MTPEEKKAEVKRLHRKLNRIMNNYKKEIENMPFPENIVYSISTAAKCAILINLSNITRSQQEVTFDSNIKIELLTPNFPNGGMSHHDIT